MSNLEEAKRGTSTFFSTNSVCGSKISKSSKSCEEPSFKHFEIELHICVMRVLVNSIKPTGKLGAEENNHLKAKFSWL